MSVLVETSPKLRSASQKRPVNRCAVTDNIWLKEAYATALDRLGSISITDRSGRIQYVNDEFVRISKFARADVIGKTHSILRSGYHDEEFYKDIYRTIGAGKVWRSAIRNRAADGSLYWMDKLIVPLRAARGQTNGYLSFGLDITNAVQAHVDLRDHSLKLQAVLDQFPGGIAVYDKDLNMLLCNDQLKQILDLPGQLFSNGLPKLEDLVRFSANRGEYGDGDVDAIISERVGRARQNTPHIYERRRPNGAHIEVRGTPLADGGLVSTYFDISQRKQDQETISRLAWHDALTGLPNRVLMLDRMDKALARVQRGDSLALFCLDLDHFKPVNDLLGHPIGDKLLVAVARRLENCVRSMDTVARIGGDEFAIIAQGVDNPADAGAIAQRIIEQIAQPFRIGDHIITVGASVGISMAPHDCSDTAHLMTNADLALYRAKGLGGGRYAYFEKAMHDRVRRRHIIEQGLREALANDGFKVHYQPIVRCADRKVVSCEALIRWSHPEQGLISAADFIPVAEETGLIGRIGEWVLRAACRDAAQWPDDVSVAVNISAAQLHGGNIVETVKQALNGLSPSRLVLEITESLLMQNTQATRETLNRLRQLGVKFALDDFGTGYSSLSYLQSFPFDKIKIDRSFVSGESNKERSATLRRAIIQLGQSLEMTTVAEGVETEEQLAQLTSENCALAQGYLFSKAVSNDEVRAFFWDHP